MATATATAATDTATAPLAVMAATPPSSTTTGISNQGWVPRRPPTLPAMRASPAAWINWSSPAGATRGRISASPAGMRESRESPVGVAATTTISVVVAVTAAVRGSAGGGYGGRHDGSREVEEPPALGGRRLFISFTHRREQKRRKKEGGRVTRYPAFRVGVVGCSLDLRGHCLPQEFSKIQYLHKERIKD